MDKTAHAAQLASCVEHTGDECVFGDSTFMANLSPLKPTDPRLEGSPDRLIEASVATGALPSPAPRRGDTLLVNARHYRVVRTDHMPTALTLILLAPA